MIGLLATLSSDAFILEVERSHCQVLRSIFIATFEEHFGCNLENRLVGVGRGRSISRLSKRHRPSEKSVGQC